MKRSFHVVTATAAALGLAVSLSAAPAPPPPAPSFPPALPGGRKVVTDTAEDFLKPAGTLRPGVAVAATAPTVDFMYVPGQDYPGKPWSAWGDSLAENGTCYVSIGDHLAPAGNAFVYEYDKAARALRRIVDVRKTLGLPEGHYTPGKIHGRIDRGSDGWLYFSTHRGSSKATTDEFHYQGDWILRHDAASGRTEVVARGPVPRHCIPCSVVDPQRMIFYGGTAPGSDGDEDGVRFFAYDLKARKLLYDGPDGPARCMILAKSTGRVYWVPGNAEGSLRRFDPATGGPPETLDVTIGIRAATEETPQGIVYAVSNGQGGKDPTLWSFDVRTEAVEAIGTAPVGTQTYVATLDADPQGRFLYYSPGAHGGCEQDGTPVVQLDVRTRRKKVVAFLHPFYQRQYGCTLRGTFSLAVDPAGDALYVTWNNSRGGKAWDSCVMTVIHLPEDERK